MNVLNMHDAPTHIIYFGIPIKDVHVNNVCQLLKIFLGERYEKFVS